MDKPSAKRDFTEAFGAEATASDAKRARLAKEDDETPKDVLSVCSQPTMLPGFQKALDFERKARSHSGPGYITLAPNASDKSQHHPIEAQVQVSIAELPNDTNQNDVSTTQMVLIAEDELAAPVNKSNDETPHSVSHSIPPIEQSLASDAPNGPPVDVQNQGPDLGDTATLATPATPQLTRRESSPPSNPELAPPSSPPVAVGLMEAEFIRLMKRELTLPLSDPYIDLRALNAVSHLAEAAPISSSPDTLEESALRETDGITETALPLPSSPVVPASSPPLAFLSPKVLDNEATIKHQPASLEVNAVPAEPRSATEGPSTTVQLSKEKEKEPSIPQEPVRRSQEALKDVEASSNLAKSSPNHPSKSSQQRSNKTIRNPFRSPLVVKTSGQQVENAAKEGNQNIASFPDLSNLPKSKRGNAQALKILKNSGPLARVKGAGTPAARAAFKSPLKDDKTPPTGKVTTKLQHKALEERLQLIRRAIKIKESGEDERLQQLAEKWRVVAKEVAWDLWGVVKDGGGTDVDQQRPTAWDQRAAFDSGSAGPNNGFQKDWGWDGTKGTPQAQDDTAEELAEEKEDPEEANAEERTMGLMLRQLGIAPETLGWNEDEGDFVEATQ